MVMMSPMQFEISKRITASLDMMGESSENDEIISRTVRTLVESYRMLENGKGG